MLPKILFAVVGLLCWAAVPAFAQDRMWFFGGASAASTTVTQVDVTNGGRTWTTTGKWAVPGGYPLAGKVLTVGGRYLVWMTATTNSTYVLAYLDTRTGQNSTFPAPSFVVPVLGSAYPIATDRESRVFVLDRGGLWVLNPRDGTVKRISLPQHLGVNPTVQAAAGRVFITGRAHIFARPEMVVMDADTGRELATFPSTWRAEFTRDEKSFYLITTDEARNYLVVLYRHDMATLARVSEVPFPAAEGSTLLDPVRLLAGSNAVFVYDADGRSLLATLPAPYSGRSVRFKRPGARSPFYAESSKPVSYFDTDHRIDVIDPSSATIVHTVAPTVASFGGVSPQAMMSVPEAPAPLAHIVNRTVTIRWDAVEHAGEYQLEAGFRPGGREIGAFNIGWSTSISIANVPAGTYYVRVRAMNELGVSAPSADVRIDVP